MSCKFAPKFNRLGRRGICLYEHRFVGDVLLELNDVPACGTKVRVVARCRCVELTKFVKDLGSDAELGRREERQVRLS